MIHISGGAGRRGRPVSSCNLSFTNKNEQKMDDSSTGQAFIMRCSLFLARSIFPLLVYRCWRPPGVETPGASRTVNKEWTKGMVETRCCGCNGVAVL